MSDITDVLMQDAVAESLVSQDGSVPMPPGWGFTSIREAPSDTEEDSGTFNDLSEEANRIADYLAGDEGEEPDAPEQDEQQARPEPRHPEQQQQPLEQQPAERTPAEIQAGIQQLGETVESLGLDDPIAAKQLAYDISAEFGGSPDAVNSEALGSCMAKTVLSAASILEAGNPNMQPIPAAAASAFTSDFLKSFGIDARETNVDANHLAATMLSGTLNFIQAVKTFGPTASLAQLNDPQACEFYVNSMMQALGVQQAVSRKDALALADAFGKYTLSVMQKLPQAAPPPSRRGASGHRSKPAAKGRAVMRSNKDLFDKDTMDYYHQQHGRL